MRRYNRFMAVLLSLVSMGVMAEGIGDRIRDGIDAKGQLFHVLVAVFVMAVASYFASREVE